MISLDALIASKAVQDQQSMRLHTSCTNVRYGSGHLQALEGSILDSKAINILEFFSRSFKYSYIQQATASFQVYQANR